MQTAAFFCPADVLYYGGQAGGGKTDLLLGLGCTVHQNSAIWRREYAQLDAIIDRGNNLFKTHLGRRGHAHFRGAPPFIGWSFRKAQRRIRLAAMQHEKDRTDWQGHPHDLKGFDEITQFLYSQFTYVIGWLRTDRVGQRCRVVACGNPPQNADGLWVLDYWAPWLREDHPRPAQVGELRYYVRFDDKPHIEVEVESKDPIKYSDGRMYFPQSRTFLPSGLDDNPWYDGGQYRSALQSMPEPLRSQLLYGDFKAGLKDGVWQGIPTAWIKAAQARWRALWNTYNGRVPEQLRILQLGIDVSRGGRDRTVLTPRYGVFFGPQLVHEGSVTEDGYKVAQLCIQAAPDSTTIIAIDVIGVGSAPYDILKKIRTTIPFNGSEATKERDKSGMLTFYNKRALWHWRMREALDPKNPEQLAIPDDPELLSDLCAWQWELTRQGIKVEDKELITKRLGRSPDKGESLIYANIPSARVDLSHAAVGGSITDVDGSSAVDQAGSPWNM